MSSTVELPYFNNAQDSKQFFDQWSFVSLIFDVKVRYSIIVPLARLSTIGYERTKIPLKIVYLETL